MGQRFFLRAESSAVINQAQLIGWRDEFLRELEGWFGGRDDRYELGGVVLSPFTYPQIFHDSSKNAINIRITQFALSGAHGGLLAKWQIAHESVHLIDPNLSPPTNVLEEGIATWYQNRTIFPRRFEPDPPYQAAKALVSQFLDSGHLQAKIRKMRASGHRIGEITSALLVRSVPGIDQLTAYRLAESFDPLHGT